MDKIRWGILSTAKIGMEKVIPAMQQSRYGRVAAIASRSEEKARQAADALGIPHSYGSYEALLDDGEIDAVYIPLPNHLHVPWSIRAMKAGKHVLCEKPIGLSAGEAEQLYKESEEYPDLKVMEAFMYRFHPQWQRAKALIGQGEIGKLHTVHSFFSYFNDDPGNIRNIPEAGGGGLMDIGCYCISLSRFLYDEEPEEATGQMEVDPDFGTDRMASGMLTFKNGTATFTCATQLTPYQRVQAFGSNGRIEIEIPFNAPPDKPTRLWVHREGETEEIRFEICNQYTHMADAFAKAVLNDTPVPTPLKDAVNNMKGIEAVKATAGIQ
ncbi:MAG: Gfo/Idh/MocA family protein [Balneolaceae bacterium]